MSGSEVTQILTNALNIQPGYLVHSRYEHYKLGLLRNRRPSSRKNRGSMLHKFFCICVTPLYYLTLQAPGEA
jgi:hypothetical protein